MRYILEPISKRIAGDITLSEDPSQALRKWREIFNVTQSDLAKKMDIAPSVLSDYERGRRQPGTKFVKKFVEALIKIDEERGYPVIRRLAGNLINFGNAILDLKEFSRPISLDTLVEIVEGIIVNSIFEVKNIYGYTVVDSIESILNMSGYDYLYLMGFTSERAIIFTNVGRGRSPMIAIRVSFLKPATVVIYGPRRSIDPLAIEIANRERIPLIISTAQSLENLLSNLREYVAAL